MRKVFLLLIMFFLFGAISGLYAGGQKSITITYRGETMRIRNVIIVNTREQGFLLENEFRMDCIVRGSMFIAVRSIKQ